MTKKEMKLAILNGKSNEIYEQLVIQYIREKYSINQELAILRQRDIKADEYNVYNDYVESCKTQAKAIVDEIKGGL